jgi:hypothetical protein
LTKIKDDFCEFGLWGNNSKKNPKKAKKNFEKAKTFCSKIKEKIALNQRKN